MSFLSKGDFKTREQWLKRQRKQIMKKESSKYHQHKQQESSIRHHIKPIQPINTLKHLLTTETEASVPNQHQLMPKSSPSFSNKHDLQLYQSMTARLKAQQTVAKDQRQQIKILQRQIQTTKTDNAIIKGVHNAASELFLEKGKIQKDNQKLKQRFQEMQKYLNKNGIYWEGQTIKGQFKIQKIKKQIKDAKANYRTPDYFDLQDIAKRIVQLNEAFLSQFGSKRYVNVSGVRRLYQAESIEIHFYRDGVMFGVIGFYPYESREGKKIMSDLKDGYYPFVLKDKYPDGALMNISFYTDQQYNEKKIDQVTQPKSAQKNWFFGKSHCLDSQN